MPNVENSCVMIGIDIVIRHDEPGEEKGLFEAPDNHGMRLCEHEGE